MPRRCREACLKVLYYTYPTAFQNPGGGETLLLKSKEYLERCGVEVDLFDQWRTKMSDYDIVHCFTWYTSSIWPRLKEYGCKVVVTPVSWFETSWRLRLSSRLKRAGKRMLYGGSAIDDADNYQAPDLFLPNSNGEAVRLQTRYTINPDLIRIVPHGVDRRFADGDAALFRKTYGLEEFVLSVGRFVKAHKNQLGLIRALKGRVDLPLVFIGSATPHERDYFEACRREADARTLFVGSIPHESPLLASAYKAASVLAMPSFLEAPGLAALEAGVAGARVAITEFGATREYFGDHVEYVNPHSPGSILSGVKRALARGADDTLKRHLLDRYAWEHVAATTRGAYESVL